MQMAYDMAGPREKAARIRVKRFPQAPATFPGLLRAGEQRPA